MNISHPTCGAMGRTVCGRRVFDVCPDVRPLSDRRRRRREMSRSRMDLDRTPATCGSEHQTTETSTSVLTISPRGSARRLRASANRDPIFTSWTTVKHHTPTCDAPLPCSVLGAVLCVRAGRRNAQTGRRFGALDVPAVGGAHEESPNDCKSSTGHRTEANTKRQDSLGTCPPAPWAQPSR